MPDRLELALDHLWTLGGTALGRIVQVPERSFRIPFNQRPWSWDREHLNALIVDIDATCDAFFEWSQQSGDYVPRERPRKNPHFFGAMVAYGHDDAATVEVVDGQQRLTAISMVTATWRELAVEIADDPSGDLDLKNSARAVVDALTNWLAADVAGGAFRPRLQVDPLYQELFENYIVKPRTAKERTDALAHLDIDFRTKRNHRRLKEGFDAVHEAVVSQLRPLPERKRISRIRALNDTLREAFVLLHLQIHEEPFALSVFERLNARGKPLTEADKVKATMFERSRLEEHSEIKAYWDEMLAAVPREDAGSFLRLRHISHYPSVQKSKLHERLVEKELTQKPVLETARLWRDDARTISRLWLLEEYPPIDGRLKDQLRALRTLGVTYAWPMLLAAAPLLEADKAKFEKYVDQAVAYAFRVLTIGREDVSALETGFVETAHIIRNGGGPSETANALRSSAAAATDAQFEENFSRFTTRSAKLQFYILFELERALSGAAGLQPFPHSPKQNIEHILPQTPSKAKSRLHEWSWARNAGNPTERSEVHKQYVNRLGNLLILEADINRDVGNYDFDAKRTGQYPGRAKRRADGTPRKSYADSVLKLVEDVRSADRWDPDAIDERQRTLAKQAVMVWTLG